MKRRKQIYWTSKEARKIAFGFSMILSLVLAGVLMREEEDVKILLSFIILMFFLLYYTLKSILRVERRKEIEKQREIKTRIRNLLGNQRKQIEFCLIDIDSEDEEMENLVEKIIEKSNFNYYAYIEGKDLIVEVRDKKDNFICRERVSWQFFDENFVLK